MAAAQSKKVAPGTAPVQALLSRQIETALKTLSKRNRPSDESIHDARKCLKRARANMRLLRETIGSTQYARENIALRDVARPLTPVRDAKVMLDTTKDLIEKEKDATSHAMLGRLRRAFLAEQRDRQAELLQDPNGLKSVIRALEQVRRRARDLKIGNGDPQALYTAMKRIYGKGRKAMKDAIADPSDEKLHEARKQAKYLAAAMTTFGTIGIGAEEKQIKRAESVADYLGDDHDVAILQQKIGVLTSGSGPADNKLSAHLKQRRAKLQKKALKEGEVLYDKKPGAFVKSLPN